MKGYFNPIKDRQAEVISLLQGSDEFSNLSEELKFKMGLCIEEIVENICLYSQSPSIEFEILTENKNLIIRFKDGGIPFDPLAKADPDITASVEERSIGGLGIFLCKQFMDRIEYVRVGESNILTMRKSL